MVPSWGLVNDIKRMCCGRALVPPWGLVYGCAAADPPFPPYTLRCRCGDWYMVLKGSAAAVPWCRRGDWYMDVLPPDPPYTLMCRRGDWYMILKMICFLQTLPTLWCFGEEMSVHLTHACG